MAEGKASDGGADIDRPLAAAAQMVPPKTINEQAVQLLFQGRLPYLKVEVLRYLRSLQNQMKESLSSIDNEAAYGVFAISPGIAEFMQDVAESEWDAKAGPCKDAYNKQVPISAKMGIPRSPLCVDLKMILDRFMGKAFEEALIELAGVMVHEHVHHYQEDPRGNAQLIASAEQEADQVGGFVKVSAGIEQRPGLKYSPKHATPKPIIGALCKDSLDLFKAKLAEEMVRRVAPTATEYLLTLYKEKGIGLSPSDLSFEGSTALTTHPRTEADDLTIYGNIEVRVTVKGEPKPRFALRSSIPIGSLTGIGNYLRDSLGNPVEPGYYCTKDLPAPGTFLVYNIGAEPDFQLANLRIENTTSRFAFKLYPFVTQK